VKRYDLNVKRYDLNKHSTKKQSKEEEDVDRKEHDRKLRKMFNVRWYEKVAVFFRRKPKSQDENAAHPLTPRSKRADMDTWKEEIGGPGS